MSDDLQPLSPRDAVRMYLEARQDELAAETLTSQEYRLEAFLQWAGEVEIDNMNDLGGRDLYEYRIWRREGEGDGRDPVARVTLRGQLATVRSLLRFAAEVDAVPEGLAEQVPLPSTDGADVSESTLDPERARAVLDYLTRYHYAERQHAMLLLMWHTGGRLGDIRALDLRDTELGSTPPGVRFVHRPTSGTPLKNGEKGERWNTISRRVASVLEDYVTDRRDDVTDNEGREPLFTTSSGRPHPTTYRSDMYRVTRPCWRGQECPHDRDPEECEATESANYFRCPSSRSPHDMRSGRVTDFRADDVPRRVVGDRLDASDDILDKHYDRRNARKKAEQRREYLPLE